MSSVLLLVAETVSEAATPLNAIFGHEWPSEWRFCLMNAILSPSEWHFWSHESQSILQQQPLAPLNGYPTVVVLVRL